MALNFAIVIFVSSLFIGAMTQDTEKTKPVDVGFELGKQAFAVKQLQQDMLEMKKLNTDLKEELVKAAAKQDAALKVEITKLNAERSAKDNALQGQISGLRGQDAALRGEVSSLRDANGAVRAEVSKLNGQDSSLKNEIAALKSKNSEFTEDIAKLTKETSEMNRKASAVEAFHAGLGADIPNHWYGVMLFNKVEYMHGYGFESKTGKFTARIYGLYAFHATMTTNCYKCDTVSELQVNGKGFGRLVVVSTPYNTQSSISVVVKLNVNDVVLVKKLAGASGLQKFPYTFFSGHLIKAF